MSRRRQRVTWTESHRIDSEDAAGEPVEISVEVTLAYQDAGIGPYEFWGARCREERWEVEILACVREDTGEAFELGEGDAERIVFDATGRRAWDLD